MSRTPKWWSLLALLATVAIVFAACQAAASPSPSSPAASQATQPSAAPASEPSEPFEGIAYPEDGEAPCGQTAEQAPEGFGHYTGNIKKITAQDAKTVVFDLCNPDVAFLSKIAFASFAINDTAWLESKIDPSASENQAIVSEVNGTGPYKLTNWSRGTEISMEANPDYWGEAPKTQTLIFRWGAEPAQRLTELQSGTVDGIDNVGAEDFPTVEDNAELQLVQRDALNVMYFGFNNNPQVEGFDNSTNPFANEQVRQAIAMGIDRERINSNFNPPGSTVATHFTPCAIPNGCAGEPWYEFDAAAAKQLLADAGYPDGFETTISYRNVARSYVSNPVGVVQDLQQQLETNLGITATLDEQESTTFIDNADAGRLPGIHMLGWGADYPDVTNFLDYHFGGGASAQFGDQFPDIVEALSEGATGANDDERAPAYETANNLIKEHVPMIPIANAGSGVAYRADVTDTHASPLGNEKFAVMTPGDRTQFVWMQNGEPGGLYCADESDGEALRTCEQMLEALYQYETGGTAAEPGLAEVCEPNAELTTWTCTLRDATFHDGATLDANDVVLSYAVQWDTQHELHKGRDGSFTYFPGLWGGFLNPPPPEG